MVVHKPTDKKDSGLILFAVSEVLISAKDTSLQIKSKLHRYFRTLRKTGCFGFLLGDEITMI